jgi:hypothetical protein
MNRGEVVLVQVPFVVTVVSIRLSLLNWKDRL